MKVLAYSKSEGETELRLKIAKYYRKIGIGIFETEIIVTNGASEALFFSLGSVMDPDDEIIIPEPFYANYNGFSAANGIRMYQFYHLLMKILLYQIFQNLKSL